MVNNFDFLLRFNFSYTHLKINKNKNLLLWLTLFLCDVQINLHFRAENQDMLKKGKSFCFHIANNLTFFFFF